MTLHIRDALPADAEACGQIMHAAFADIAGRHGFPADFPSAEAATGLARSLIANPAVFGVVAETAGRIVGSNFLGEGDAIRGVGPITVEPEAQGSGVGRRLMRAVLERGQGAAGIRLLQDGFNMRSLALYASLGFIAREPMVVMAGRPADKPPAGTLVRPLRDDDVAPCDELCVRAHGLSRRAELLEAQRHLAPLVAQREGRVTAYLTAPGLWLANHGVAESEADLRALILGAAATVGPLSFLLPIRRSGLLAWCLDQGLRAVKPMMLMSVGTYQEAARPYLPSVFY